MMGLSGGKRIAKKRLAVLIQSTRATHYGKTIAYTHASIASREQITANFTVQL